MHPYSISVLTTCPPGAELGRALTALGHQVSLHVHEGLHPQQAGALAQELAAEWRHQPPDVVLSYGWTAGLAALAARDQQPLVHAFDGPGSLRHGYLSRNHGISTDQLRLERAICHDADRLLARSNDEAEAIVRIGVPRSRVTVVPGGVDLETFTPHGPTLATATPGHRLVCVGQPGNLDRHAGVDTAILALQGLPDAELYVAGGPQRDQLAGDPEIQRLRRLAHRAGVAERVHLLGELAPERLPRLLRSADVVVSVPSYVPYGNAALEAMSCGRAVVASAVTGHLDTVIEGMTGVFVPPGRPKALARALRELLSDPLLPEGFGVAARERAEIRHSWSRIAEETTAVIAQIAQSSTHREASAGFRPAAGVSMG